MAAASAAYPSSAICSDISGSTWGEGKRWGGGGGNGVVCNFQGVTKTWRRAGAARSHLQGQLLLHPWGPCREWRRRRGRGAPPPAWQAGGAQAQAAGRLQHLVQCSRSPPSLCPPLTRDLSGSP